MSSCLSKPSRFWAMLISLAYESRIDSCVMRRECLRRRTIISQRALDRERSRNNWNRRCGCVMRRGNTWNGNGIRAAVEKTDGMSTYIYLEIVSSGRGLHLLAAWGKNRKDLNLSSGKSIIMNIHQSSWHVTCAIWGEISDKNTRLNFADHL